MNRAEKLFLQVKKSLYGKDETVSKALTAFLAGGHLLLEDIPGVGKTTLSKAIADASGLETKRIQFTPDTLPSDITGFTLWDAEKKSFRFHKGAVMTNILLADEINRTSPRTQSALLQAMEEGCVTEEGTVYPLEQPFMVIATQNPLGSAGTMPLPPSQLDRFMMRLSIGRPEMSLLSKLLYDGGNESREEITAVLSKNDITELQHEVGRVLVSQPIADWIAELTEKTHSHEMIIQGASPRAAISLMRASKAAAYFAGRDFVIPSDISWIFADCFAHRLVMREGASAEKVCEEILKDCQPPHSRGSAK